jgi:hypothetical protein
VAEPRIIQTATSLKCSVCRSPNRARADALIASVGTKDSEGSLIVWAGVLPFLATAVGRDSLSLSAAKNHRKHFRVVREGESEEPEGDGTAAVMLAEEQAALLDDIDQQLAGGSINPTRVRQLQARGALLDLRRKVAAGERLPPLSPDQLGRVLEGIERRQSDAERTELLTALGGAISQVMERELGPGSERPARKQIEGAEVIEVEPVEDED